MRLKHTYKALLTALTLLASCAEDNVVPSDGTADGSEQNYSFTAILGEGKSRVSYLDDPDSKNLKMVWDEGDVIRLYPDKSMGDKVDYYEFTANTGAGTNHTVFVHQGYILNWEHWSGKAIYVFPGEDNIDVEADSQDFLSKAYIQKTNGSTEHLKYAEHQLDADGSKHYTEYWSDNLVDANLKHDHKMTFSHPHTVVYKVMLRGFIFDIPGGSQLRMSGEAWPDGEVTTLTLGDKDDKEPFVKVGEYGKDNYEDNVLTAYIVRQVVGDVDGKIGTGGKLKFELLCYDELDGTVMPLDPEDEMRNDNPDYGPHYLTNLPWGDEYTWDVTATADIEYKAGDFVVADLTDTSMDYAYPKVAVDLGLPLKWAAFNLGAKKIDESGAYVVWGYTKLFSNGGKDLYDIYNGEWDSGDPERDAASFHWGDEWRTPTVNEFLDLVHYAEWLDSNDIEATDATARWKFDLAIDDRIYYFETNPARDINGVSVALVKSKANSKYIYMHIAGNVRDDNGVKATDKAYYNTSSSKNDRLMIMGILQESSHAGLNSNKYYLGYTDNNYGRVSKLAASIRGVKN